MSPEQRKQYEKFLMNLASEKDVIDTAREEGHSKGEQIGLQKGEQIRKQKEDMAIQNALRKGKLSPEEIAEMLEVSMERVMEINKKLN